MQSCSLDCVYNAEGDDVCLDACPTDDRGATFCGSSLGLPDDTLYTCLANRVITDGACANGCVVGDDGTGSCAP